MGPEVVPYTWGSMSHGPVLFDRSIGCQPVGTTSDGSRAAMSEVRSGRLAKRSGAGVVSTA